MHLSCKIMSMMGPPWLAAFNWDYQMDMLLHPYIPLDVITHPCPTATASCLSNYTPLLRRCTYRCIEIITCNGLVLSPPCKVWYYFDRQCESVTRILKTQRTSQRAYNRWVIAKKYSPNAQALKFHFLCTMPISFICEIFKSERSRQGYSGWISAFIAHIL